MVSLHALRVDPKCFEPCQAGKQEIHILIRIHPSSNRISGWQCGEMEHDPHRNAGDIYRPVPWCSAATWIMIQSATSRVVCYILCVCDNLERGHCFGLALACESLNGRKPESIRINMVGYFLFPAPLVP